MVLEKGHRARNHPNLGSSGLGVKAYIIYCKWLVVEINEVLLHTVLFEDGHNGPTTARTSVLLR